VLGCPIKSKDTTSIQEPLWLNIMSSSDDENMDGSNKGGSSADKQVHSVIRFPQSKTKPKTSQQAPRDLGLSKLALKLNASASLKGHWCSRCKGIWYGYGGECECPVCGNRNG